ncbi:methyltransferase domain-containing protein [Haloarcula sp. CBA1130]|uniref:class I SAM-dependent methyltransferase n=1 Tax=unclassified Haloarcula TaxID=2624677 RepID=UPI00124769BB|nr:MULTISPECIES: class I SAM-dependent methyltransferase [unclassified Haloarcula]KAA9395814.1 methyltransferase domain-containing protein [Haloarcula sp. CBA1129]KAA9400254.1 methyltransferase domain-containing protein [Haloarcula sp. CBA1130]
MGYHTFDAGRADKLEDAQQRYRFLSAEELRWALSPDSDETVADLGSGTGFYTDEVAPAVDHVYAVDIQDAMHDYYREKGVPDNVDLVTSAVDDLPFETSSLDGAFSTMTYHEFASDGALHEVARVLTSGGTLAIADWAASGSGSNGPPVDERFSADEATNALRRHGFTVEFEAVRPETFLLVASAE